MSECLECPHGAERRGPESGCIECPCRRLGVAGSSVPEAAMEAAYDAAAGYWSDGGYTAPVEAAVHAAAPFIVAAASVELQQEVDRLSTECEALRGTVAEERATTGRLLALLADMDERGRVGSDDSLLDLQSRRQIREDVKRFRAALASPGEGERPFYPWSPAGWYLDLLRAVKSYDDANQSDLPLGLLDSIREAVAAGVSWGGRMSDYSGPAPAESEMTTTEVHVVQSGNVLHMGAHVGCPICRPHLSAVTLRVPGGLTASAASPGEET